MNNYYNNLDNCSQEYNSLKCQFSIENHFLSRQHFDIIYCFINQDNTLATFEKDLKKLCISFGDLSLKETAAAGNENKDNNNNNEMMDNYDGNDDFDIDY